jgi:hypothetical protein
MFLPPHATRVFDPRAMGLPQVKAAGLVQVFDLPRLHHRAAPSITNTGCATSCHACIIVTHRKHHYRTMLEPNWSLRLIFPDGIIVQ